VLIISTPKGLNMFYKFWNDAVNNRNEYVPIEVHWSQVPGRDDKWKEQTIANTSEEQFRGEFECVSGETLVNVRDKETGEILEVSMKDLFDFLC
jgi:hypothetical protein